MIIIIDGDFVKQAILEKLDRDVLAYPMSAKVNGTLLHVPSKDDSLKVEVIIKPKKEDDVK